MNSRKAVAAVVDTLEHVDYMTDMKGKRLVVETINTYSWIDADFVEPEPGVQK